LSGPGVGEIAEQLRRSTVQVRVDEGRSGSGSGVVWNTQGLIISNAHVVRGSKVEVEFWDGKVAKARVLRREAGRDLAFLDAGKMEAPAPRWGDSSRLEAGDAVLAVGNPLGFVGAVSNGVVQAVGPIHGLGKKNWIQAHIRLAPGNSGGAMANASGEVVGINTMVAGPLGLAIPSTDVASFVERASGSEEPPILGITIEAATVRVGSQLALGFRIQQIMPDSKAQFASLRPGDVIIGVDGEFFSSPDDLEDRLLKRGLMRLEFLRGSTPVPREVTIALGTEEKGRLKAAA